LNREELIKKFYSDDVFGICFDTLLKADTELKKNKSEISSKILKAVSLFFEQLAVMQEENKKGGIYCIGFQLLRTKIMNKECQILISAYDRDFYNDKSAVHAYFDLPEIFGYLRDVERHLMPEKGKYVGKINSDDVETAVQKMVELYKNYMVKLVKLALKEVDMLDCFNKLKKDPEFFIMAGEYKDKLEFIYRTPQPKSEIETKKIVKSINGKPKEEFAGEMFNDMQLARLDLRNENFCFSNFDRSDLSFSDFRVSFCIGTEFKNCTMLGASFEHAFLHDADFRNSRITGVSFKGANGDITTPTRDVLYSPGFYGVDFRNAILQEVDFTDGIFTGSDFRNVEFKETTFEGTKLDGAVFDKRSIEALNFSPEQLSKIITV